MNNYIRGRVEHDSLPIRNITTTFVEIPGEVAVAFEVGNCTQNCPGCHTKAFEQMLSAPPISEIMYGPELLLRAETAKTLGCTAIVLMGGTTNNVPPKSLARIIDALSRILPVGIYSGKDDFDTLKDYKGLKWIKTGSYVAALGGLDNPKTNQKFFTGEDVVVMNNGVYDHTETEWTETTKIFQRSK